MRPRDRVSRVLLLIVAIVRFSTMSSATAQQPKLLMLRLSPEKPAETLDDIPDKWRTILNGKYRAPQMEIHLLKDQVSPDENLYFMNKYKYSGPNYDAKTRSAIDERQVFTSLVNDGKLKENARENKGEDSDVFDDIVMPDRIIPPIGFRNIIYAPTFCPIGQMMDSIGHCRPVLECELSSLSSRRAKGTFNLMEISHVFRQQAYFLVALTKD